MLLYPKTVWYLYKMVLEQPKFQNQPTVLKPFYLLSVLWLCILIAIPICTLVLRSEGCLEVGGVV